MNSRQSVLVTGSSSGIGRAISEILARKGHTVFATMRNVKGKNAPAAQALQAMAQAEQLALHIIELDVTSDASVQAGVEQAIGIAGHLDAVVNNAGIMAMGLSEAMTVSQVQQMYDINVFGTFRVVQAVLPHMRQRGSGYLIYVSSMGADVIFPFMGLYCSAKAAMSDIAKSIHYDVYKLGIDTTIIQAGGYATSMVTNLNTPQGQNLRDEYGTAGMFAEASINNFAEVMAPGRAGDPPEVGNLIADLLEKPTGQRPLSQPVGPLSEFLAGINSAREMVQSQIIAGMGLDTLLTRP